MKTLVSLALFVLLGGTLAHARDGFENVRCDGDIPKALIGQRAVNEPVVKIEARHKDLKLQDLGASDYGSFSSITWLICGQDFMMLQENRSGLIRDVLPIPPHSKSSPAFEGLCKLNGKPMKESTLAILREKEGAQDLPAAIAWKIDEKAIKFVKISADGLLCPRDGGILDPR